MRYSIGDRFNFKNGETGIITSAETNIIGGEEYEIDVNGEIKNIIIQEDGKIQYC